MRIIVHCHTLVSMGAFVNGQRFFRQPWMKESGSYGKNSLIFGWLKMNQFNTHLDSIIFLTIICSQQYVVTFQLVTYSLSGTNQPPISLRPSAFTRPTNQPHHAMIELWRGSKNKQVRMHYYNAYTYICGIQLLLVSSRSLKTDPSPSVSFTLIPNISIQKAHITYKYLQLEALLYFSGPFQKCNLAKM